MYRLRSTEIFHHAENALPQRGEHAAEHADVLCFAKLHAVRRGKVDVIDLRGAGLVHARGGRRPSFIAAARPEEANERYEQLVAAWRAQGIHVETGRFRADMQVSLVNDGPVTILMDSTKAF